MKRKKSGEILIPGQSIELCRDIHQANIAGITYGVHMGRKHSERQEQINNRRKKKATAAV